MPTFDGGMVGRQRNRKIISVGQMLDDLLS
jgi:hypothetical protein